MHLNIRRFNDLVLFEVLSGAYVMSSTFYTPIASKAIIVERETGMRLFWFWPLAALVFSFFAYIYWKGHPAVMLMMSLFAIIPLSGLMWMELKSKSKEPQTLLSWHGGRLYLFDKGKHVRTLHAKHIQHIELSQGRTTCHLVVHTNGEIIHQKLVKLGRGSRLQIQRIVRCLQAELAYKNSFDDLPEDLATIAREI